MTDHTWHRDTLIRAYREAAAAMGIESKPAEYWELLADGYFARIERLPSVPNMTILASPLAVATIYPCGSWRLAVCGDDVAGVA